MRTYPPRHAGEATAIPATGREDALRTGTETILLVEDGLMILRLGKILFEGLGYTVLTAATPGEAIRLAEAHVGRIHRLITEVVIPEMNGHDLARRLPALVPGLRSVFVSGYTADKSWFVSRCRFDMMQRPGASSRRASQDRSITGGRDGGRDHWGRPRRVVPT